MERFDLSVSADARDILLQDFFFVRKSAGHPGLSHPRRLFEQALFTSGGEGQVLPIKSAVP